MSSKELQWHLQPVLTDEPPARALAYSLEEAAAATHGVGALGTPARPAAPVLSHGLRAALAPTCGKPSFSSLPGLPGGKGWPHHGSGTPWPGQVLPRHLRSGCWNTDTGPRSQPVRSSCAAFSLLGNSGTGWFRLDPTGAEPRAPYPWPRDTPVGTQAGSSVAGSWLRGSSSVPF